MFRQGDGEYALVREIVYFDPPGLCPWHEAVA